MKNIVRKSVMSTFCVAAGLALISTPAHAYSSWTVKGPDRSTYSAAESDIPATVAQCRKNNGRPGSSIVEGGGPVASTPFIYQALTACSSLRG